VSWTADEKKKHNENIERRSGNNSAIVCDPFKSAVRALGKN
jgi:hypothetical protein